ncbi:MAG TPA: hypothetical protein V6C52_14595 [Coleofasciculaceae cyanobacterium]|jgi:diadenosine tetraphosphatase ApaH/serine/threonine PP2A family protein phosphatase
MPPESNPTPEEDIRQALECASAEPEDRLSGKNHSSEPLSDAIARDTHNQHWRMARYTLMKCGLMAEKYPWQTVVLLLGSVGCGWVCSYFGWSVLGAAVLYAASSDE